MGLLKTAAKVAVASHVHGNVKRRQQRRWAAQDGAVAPLAPAPVMPAQAPPAPLPAAPMAQDVVLAQLTELARLRTAGILTDAEFETQKARILAK